MPTYEFICLKCGEEFIRTMSLKEFETAKLICPKCGSEDIKQQMSQIITKTSRKS